MGLGYPGMGQAGLATSHQPSGDLLAMINKTGGAGQLSNLGSLGQGFGGQQQQGVQGNAVAGQAQGQVCMGSRVVAQWGSLGGIKLQACSWHVLDRVLCMRLRQEHRHQQVTDSFPNNTAESHVCVSGRSAADGPWTWVSAA